MPRTSRDPSTDLGLLALALIWGVNFSVMKAVLEELDPLALNALRFPLAALALWAVAPSGAGRWLPEREDRTRILALGILGLIIADRLWRRGLRYCSGVMVMPESTMST